MATVAYDVQSAIEGVKRSVHGGENVGADLSRHVVPSDIGQVYRGMMVALPPGDCVIFRDMGMGEYVAFLEGLARAVDLARHPEAGRGPEKERPERKYDPAQPDVSVAELLLAGKPNGLA